MGLRCINLRSVVCTVRANFVARALHLEDTFGLRTLLHGDEFFCKARWPLEVTVHISFVLLASLHKTLKALRHFNIISHAGLCPTYSLVGLVLLAETSVMHRWS